MAKKYMLKFPSHLVINACDTLFNVGIISQYSSALCCHRSSPTKNRLLLLCENYDAWSVIVSAKHVTELGMISPPCDWLGKPHRPVKHPSLLTPRTKTLMSGLEWGLEAMLQLYFLAARIRSVSGKSSRIYIFEQGGARMIFDLVLSI